MLKSELSRWQRVVSEMKNGNITVVIFQEKYGDTVYVANSEASLSRLFLSVLKNRWDEGCYFSKPAIEAARKPTLTQFEIDKLKKGPVKEAAILERQRYKAYLVSIQNDFEEYLRAEQAIKNQDGKGAYSALANRRHGEYEDFTVEVISPS